MGKIRLLCAATFSLLLFINSRCKKSDAEPQLPPETTTGAGTFGCKVNGKIFIPKSGGGQPGLYADYVYYNTGPGAGWYLNIVAIYNQSSNSTTVNIVTDSLFLEEGHIYDLKEKKGFAAGRYSYGLNAYEMRMIDSGKMTIVKHDQTKRILSGNFWFNAKSLFDTSIVKITEGRFDIIY
ncbi:MAG TPA: hypothetical protein VIY47_12435 [Ignavibacteriaceae bacterium]